MLIVGKLIGDAFLGMPFLVKGKCAINFLKPTVTMGGSELVCTDKLGRLLINNIQFVCTLKLKAQVETLVLYRVIAQEKGRVGVIKSKNYDLKIANSTGRPDGVGRLWWAA